jgi:hypothetical protein
MRRSRESTLPPIEPLHLLAHDDTYLRDKQVYEREKRVLIAKQADRVARVKRLGYDLSVLTQRPIPDEVHE